MMDGNAVVALSTVLITGAGCQWVAWRVRLPAILFLLFSGILAGPVMNWLNPDQLFGGLLSPFISLAVAVILFEGSLTLRFEDIPGLEKVIRNMITFGALVTWLITALATRWLLHFSWEVSFLFGALMVVTGPTVITPMLRTIRPKENVAHILRWEGILIDPIGATLAILVFEVIVSGGAQAGATNGIMVFGKILAIGVAVGVAGGYSLGVLIRHHWVPQYLNNLMALAFVCVVFALSDRVVTESGLLSVTVMGIWLANMTDVELEDILDFKESLSLLFISVLFILLAARMDLNALVELGWPALAVFCAIQFLSRPLNAQISALGSKLSMAERHLLAWIAPRGIVAAAISALFAIKLEAIGYAEASRMVPLTFMVIIGTVLLQSVTAGPIARWLHVTEPEPKGFLIIGASNLARSVAKVIQANGVTVLLADQSWDNIKLAKMQGLPTYWGNPVSEHAERHLSLSGIGRVLALSSSRNMNTLAAWHYRMEFGDGNIFTIKNIRSDDQSATGKSNIKRSGKPLFEKMTTYEELDELLDGGAEIKTTPLTEKFTYEDYLRQLSEYRIPLFAVDSEGRLHPFTEAIGFSPKSDWKIIALSAPRPAGKDLDASESRPPDPSG